MVAGDSIPADFLVQDVLASPSSVIGCATGTVSGTMQGSGAMPCLRIIDR